MRCALVMMLAVAAFVVSQVEGDTPSQLLAQRARPLPDILPQLGLPVGKWSVEFANGVTEVCEIRNDSTASVEEPLRKAQGKAEIKGGSVVIVFEDDRVERWTPVGKRLVVEHWFPGSQFPTATPVLGIAERVQ